MTYLVQLVIILLLTKLGAHVSNLLKFPSVIGELLVGVLAGPAVLHLLAPTTFIQYFSEFGVIILMFIAGLEGDLGLLMRYWRPALTVATLGVIFPTASAAALCIFVFNFQWTTAIFIGLVLSATSVSISVQVLKEMHRLNSREGAIILGAAVADDIMCVILLGVCVGLFGSGASASNQSLPLMLFTKLLFFAAMFVLGKWFVPRFLQFFSKLTASENETTAALILCFGFAALAVALGMSDVLGAYFAGLAISETKFKDKLALKIEPIGYAVFIPVFFVSIGLNISFAGMQGDLAFIIALIVIAVLGKQIGGALGARLFHLDWPAANIVGAGMISRGEMALVVANVALSSHLIDQNHYTAMIIVTVVTTIIAPFVLKIFIQQSDKQKANSMKLNEVKQ
ncbi:cation:proton antiporter [Loigolactobacillus backii]|uniref:Sodium:proton antiporter n=1 Tax=Loigolactobacillus backii TaxID=375175 RepID=A0A192GZZ7_9LACO|nr:cation:proton antiporter [Loigolactobacillus backii]ANK62109.1 sodium:proton antiporter [Loigolactobacillus backii]ANK68696.1 sodium:proton antiporter [Loigolactobacillus backii]MDA5386699.1 cation:proton antiporter [Loigolactobacillus backii]MDA5389224.1 cation:proton antiporter [Loigolactobacillus backii]